ncbi:MAG: acyclic terpene utilization AtuA family protein [Alphaproteobacteria bacterium]
MNDPIYIAGASGFWGDSDAATAQLVNAPKLDFIIYDYLSEITLALLARARNADPEKGFIPDFERAVLPHLATLKEKGVKLLANAGGLNPVACAKSLEAKARAAGTTIKVVAVGGDDIIEKIQVPLKDMFSQETLPNMLLSANAYLGASGIIAALEAGADVVITGRCADSALTLGPLVHAFGWEMDDWDKLAQGSLAGHLIECGSQGAGGLFTDWETVPGWENMGFPIAACKSDGTFEVTKMGNTGGLISPLSLAEQMLYEIGDPADYRLPDVICDFRHVHFKQTSPNSVRVTNAHGLPAPSHYKASVTWQDGWRLTATLMIGGIDAVAKARRVGQAILNRTERIGLLRNLTGFRETSVEVIGAEDSYGPHARMKTSREVILKIAAAADDRSILQLLSREIFPSATAMSPGITGVAGGRPKPAPIIRGSGALIPRDQIKTSINLNGKTTHIKIDLSLSNDSTSSDQPHDEVQPVQALEVKSGINVQGITGARLIDFAVARSGDKGDLVNIGVIARSEEAWMLLREGLTASKVEEWLDHLKPSKVERFELPGSQSLNFVLHNVLNGGGMANLKFDAQGKAFAQMLLDMPKHCFN